MRLATIIFIMLLSLSMVSAECFDSDNGKNKYDFGAVTDGGETYEDTCDNDNITEYFCSADDIASFTTLPCVNGCEGGECQLANEIPVAAAPEGEEGSYTLYFYGITILVILGLYLYWFKLRPRRRR